MSEPEMERKRERVEAYDRSDCPNGPDEYGNWPCDPKLAYGNPVAECQVCGRIASWESPVMGRRV